MISLFNMLPDEKKRHNTFGLMDMFEGVKDAILPILSNTPYGSATRKIKEHGRDFTRELGEGLYHDLPQGVIDLGTDIINRGGNLLGVEGDFIDRKSVQVVPPVFDEEERKKLGMKSLEEDSVGRILGQLLGGYAGIRGVLSKGLMSEAVAVSGAGSTLDPTKPNLSNFIQDTRFNNLLFEYMSAGVPEEAGAEERLLARVGNMTEELGLAFIPLGLIQGLRAMKNNPAIKEEILDTFHPDRMGGLLSDKTGLTTDYRMFAAPDVKGSGWPEGTPYVDEAGFFMKSEQQVHAMPQDKMKASHVAGYLKKRGVSESEMNQIGLLDMLDGLPEGEMITKQGLLDYIDENRIEMKASTLLPGQKQVSRFQDISIPDPNHASLVMDIDYSKGWQQGMSFTDPVTGNSWRVKDNYDKEHRIQELWEELKEELNEGDFVMPDNMLTPQRDGSMMDTITMLRELHNLFPDKYPKTAAIRMAEIRDEIDEVTNNMRKIDRDNTLTREDEGGTVLRLGNEEAEKARQSLRDKSDELWEELSRIDSKYDWGDEWDYQVLSDLSTQGDNYADIDTIKSALDEVVEKTYLKDPDFEIKVGSDELGRYTITGSDRGGWQTYSDETGLPIYSAVERQGLMGPDLPHDLNEAQVQLRSHIITQGYMDIYGGLTGEAKWADEKWVQPNADMDTYSEELIQWKHDKDDIYLDDYEGGHYGRDFKNTMMWVRKTIRTGKVTGEETALTTKGDEVGLMDIDDNVYFIEEIQSDWHQQGRQFGYGKKDYEAKLADNLKREKEIAKMEKIAYHYEYLHDKYYESKALLGGEEHLKGYDTSLIIRKLPETIEEMDYSPPRFNVNEIDHPRKGSIQLEEYLETSKEFIDTIPNWMLQKAFQLGDESGHRALNYSTYTDADVSPSIVPYEQLSYGDQMKEIAEGISPQELNARWKTDKRNPESENFEGFGYADIKELNKWIIEEAEALKSWREKAKQYNSLGQVPEYSPLKEQDRWINTGFRHALTKAIEGGHKRIAWPTGEMILDIWNKSGRVKKHGKVEFKELYENLYDKKLLKGVKKLVANFGGKIGKMDIDGQEVNYLQITDELIKNLQKEAPPRQMPVRIQDRDKEGKGLLTPQSLYAKYPLPIGAGLLGMQEEKNQSGLLN